jgi:hypothetical protein
MFKLSAALVIVSIIFSACHVKVGEDNKDDGGGNGGGSSITTYATYEMIEGCSTGIKKFNAGSEDELTTMFCDGLKNNEANGNCAQYQREQAFKAFSCPGAWPHAVLSGTNMSSTQSYSYKVNSCSTGFHYISSSNSELGKKAYCKSLLNDDLNANCARSKREETFATDGCKAE